MEMGWKGEKQNGVYPDAVVILCRMEMGWKSSSRDHQVGCSESRNPLPYGDGLEAWERVCVLRIGGLVVILCRMEMGWKDFQPNNQNGGNGVVILCRMEMGWKIGKEPYQLPDVSRNPLPYGDGLEDEAGVKPNNGTVS